MAVHNCFLVVCLSLVLSTHYYCGSVASTIIRHRNESQSQEETRTQFGVHYYQHIASGNEDIIISETTIIDTSDEEIQRYSSGSGCITEIGLELDLYGGTFVMAPTDTFSRESFGQCLHFCMSHAPAQSHLLISYYNALLIGDKFNCMCSDEENLRNTTQLSEAKCDVKCPYSNYMCGDAKKDILSAYCLHRGCKESGDLAPNEPICARRLPHDIHGCIKHDFVDWSRSHNARNFTAALEGDSACIWECRDNHMGSIFALTRIVGNVRTCSCGFPGSFNLNQMVDPEFCKIFKDEHGIDKDHDYYNVNCVTDLDDGGSTPIDGGGRCDSVGPVGCIYLDLVPSQLQNQFKIQVSHSEDFPDVTKCLLGCRAIFPDAFFAGVRLMPTTGLDNGTNELECSCLQPHAFNSSTLGPSANCNQFCGHPTLGLLCGNDPERTEHASLSLYCLAGGESGASSPTSRKSGQIRTRRTSEDQLTGNQQYQKGFNNEEMSSLMPILQGIDKTVSKQNVTTEVLVGLLTFLCIILVSIVVYLCYTRGISSLSRYVM